ncbi:hypothetical protein ACPCIX_11270 [Streptomyces pseudogriseolus]|uniref:Uncharacterized protein n=3 Tax=Streptomyces TaxID=1883 RepID=M3D0Q3_STREZ|nr:MULTISPECIES: hypothetical protein [Streptomyces]EMF29978.1 hypothetical protein H114_06131 [Streptomyces gancidicus BKS 13-15]MCI4141840.1 hypothetical protein [Streptomyces sp. MMS20-AI2-20]GGP93306.1 hypothetical protein GCM10010233_06620 [Streptomyces gancidicus]GGS35128.1 hypothetical protein GCM10010285_12880 [Streptomyces rubiginosus]
MSFGQGGSSQQWDPWKPNSQQQPWSGGSAGGSPDWAALADASEARAKRRRLLFIGGGALAAVAIGTAVAVAVVSAGGSNQASPGAESQLPGVSDLPSQTGTVPSFEPTSAPPPLDPKDFVASAQKDKAPLSPDILFPGTQLTMGDTVYKKGPTADTKNCASAAKATLPKVLTTNDCTRLIRVTYSRDGVAVTVGVAVFATEAQATKAKQQADEKSIVKSLSGGGVKDFCVGAVCRSTTNAYGRYAYFTLSGFTSGKDVTEKDKAVFKTGDDLQEFTYRQIRRRGEAQASAAAVG